jgi:hypothetical protein
MTGLSGPTRFARRPTVPRERAWARRRRAALLLVFPAITACYSTVPLQPVPTPGTTVLLDLNDRGRAELGDRIGPGATTIEATLDARTDTTMNVRVNAVRYLNGQTNAWTGEPMTIPTRLVGQSWQRSFSRGRATVLGTAVAAALVLLIRNTSFLGGSSGGTRPDPGGGSGSS